MIAGAEEKAILQGNFVADIKKFTFVSVRG